MSQPDYEILPATRSWDAVAEELANKLANGLSPTTGAPAGPDSRGEVAGLGLLLRLHPDVWTAHPVRSYMNVDWRAESASVITGAYVVYWAGLAHAVRYEQTLAASDRAAIQLACSLADGQVLVCLGATLGALTDEMREHFIDAVAFAAGRVR